VYHKINLPDCAAQLMALTQLARKTIAFGLLNDTTIVERYTANVKPQNDLANRLGREFLDRHGGQRLLAAARAEFIQYFAREGQGEVGRWLWKKRVIIAKPIVELLVIPHENKRRLLRVFDHDTSLEPLFNRARAVRLLYRSTSLKYEAAKTIVKQILLSFYEDILADDGVPGTVLDEVEALDHQSFLRSYRKSQGKIRVCPGCDGQGLQVQGDTIRANIDHFLPKSEYPFLAIHPLNLAPFCTDCNQVRKGSKDALASPGVQSLRDIYHPYVRGAHDDIRVVVTLNNENKLQIRLLPADVDRQSQARLSSLLYVLDLESFWQGTLCNDPRDESQLDIEIERAIRHAFQDEFTAREQFDDAELRNKLTRISQGLIRDIGRLPNSVATHAYAQWLATDEQAAQRRRRLYFRALGLEEGATNPLEPTTASQKVA
jgi:hypothetical protein